MYYLPLFISFLLFFQDILSDKKKYILLVCLTTLIITFRFGVGSDYFSYNYLYNVFQVSNIESFFYINDTIEIGFKLIMLPFKLLGAPYEMFVAFISGVSLYFSYRWINDVSSNKFISVFLFYTMFSIVWIMSAQRQGLVLSISLYYLFNDKFKFKFFQELLIIILLSTIHLSSLFLIITIVLRKFNWSQKTLLALFFGSIAFSYLPISEIVKNIPIIPEKFLGYLTSNGTIFDFPSLVRIGLFAFVLFFYHTLADSKHNMEMTNSVLIGFALFFFTKFTGLGAARLVIYNFALLIVLIPKIYINYSDSKQVKTLITLLIFTFGTLYFQKDINSFKYESGYTGSAFLLKYHSIWNKNYLDYNNLTAFIVFDTSRTSEKYTELSSFIPNVDTAKYVNGDVFHVVENYSNNLFGVINQRGEVVIEPKYESKPAVYGTILLLSFDEPLVDLTFSDKNQEELIKVYSENREKQLYYDDLAPAQVGNLDFMDLPSELRQTIKFEQSIRNIEFTEFNSDLKFRIINFNYFGFDYTAYTDENNRLLFNWLSFTDYRPSINGFFEIHTRLGIITLNFNGEVVWK